MDRHWDPFSRKRKRFCLYLLTMLLIFATNQKLEVVKSLFQWFFFKSQILVHRTTSEADCFTLVNADIGSINLCSVAHFN